ncbi:hypothetical protein BAU15_12965 [Enterococcus sp. JM4C]|uniref:ECF transporter S component n=1 Tax=Candidatus Enterococcus huntleyi TaxID=1857217 RepID=UPI00137A11D0|nr:ECF transporter S component [Enterococcus sp. JM4C]KAF1297672.1 hypothetical protein BAU15_12965 [Enterococcus sp. JM4C]
MNKKISLQSIVQVALFAALTMVGTTIRIPFPGAFVHLGNAVLLLAVLLIGYKGALASGIGFALFDSLNGYITEAPYFLVESLLVGGVAYLLFLLFKKNPSAIWQLLVIGAGTGLAKIVMTQLKNTVMNVLAGADLSVAFTGALAKLPATLINVCITMLIVTLVYFPLRKSMSVIFRGSVH